MYIDTHTRENIVESICKLYDITNEELITLLNKAGEASCVEKCMDICKFDKVIEEFLRCNNKHKKITKLFFYHLGRRLDTVKDDETGKNLYELLSTDNAMSRYLKEHDIKFIPQNGCLKLYYKDTLILLDDINEDHVPYLRWRFGYNNNCADYCFNGFLLKDLLLKNDYTLELFNAPEFLTNLARFLDNEKLITDYLENSKFYCFEYLAPIEKIKFDDEEDMTIEEKQMYLVTQIMHRLYQYKVNNSRYVYDHDNPILRLADDDRMDTQYFVSKEIITLDMIGS